jgi:hypothetical protein
MSRQAYLDYEDEKKEPKLSGEVAQKIGRYLQVREEWLMWGKGEMWVDPHLGGQQPSFPARWIRKVKEEVLEGLKDLKRFTTPGDAEAARILDSELERQSARLAELIHEAERTTGRVSRSETKDDSSEHPEGVKK